MEPVKPDKPAPKKVALPSTVSLRVKRETRRKIEAELVKANKKELGRKISCDELLLLALSLIQEPHIRTLQDATLTNADRLQRSFRAYCKTNPPVTYDEFLGRLLRDKAVAS